MGHGWIRRYPTGGSPEQRRPAGSPARPTKVTGRRQGLTRRSAWNAVRALLVLVLGGVTGWAGTGSAAPAELSARSPQPALALNGQVVVDPAHPQWLKYHNGGPFFMCGPGDPEDFLYRGTRNQDGTRDGDQAELIDKVADAGANAIYLMSVRSHGGDGDTTHNPFIDSDPSKGLDPDILAQWAGWFQAMDDEGILVFFILYDDGSRIWNTGDSVGANERAFIQGLVGTFSGLKHLIWVVAEEYQERYTPTRVSNIAAEIRTADPNDHPIAVHKTIGLSFPEFADDPNIDQFAIQYSSTSPDGFHSGIVSAWQSANGRYNLNMAEGHPDAFGDDARLRSWATALGGSYVMHLRWDIAQTDIEDLRDCGRLVSFMESIPFQGMAPNDALALGATEYVLADPGNAYIAYSPDRQGNMGLASITAGQYSFKWLDIVSGTVVTQADVSLQAGNQSWTSPSGMGSEVAVYLQRTGPLATLPGDLNQDGQVDIVDVQLGANAVLGLENDPGILERADINDDGQLDILDVQSIVNLVLVG